jgi:hypothetical protein
VKIESGDRLLCCVKNCTFHELFKLEGKNHGNCFLRLKKVVIDYKLSQQCLSTGTQKGWLMVFNFNINLSEIGK